MESEGLAGSRKRGKEVKRYNEEQRKEHREGSEELEELAGQRNKNMERERGSEGLTGTDTGSETMEVKGWWGKEKGQEETGTGMQVG